MQKLTTRLVLWATLASLAVLLGGVAIPAIGQDDKPAAKKAATGKAKKSRGRLPSYYRMVVDEKQRETIYKVQAEYKAKINALKAELAALIKERDGKIAAVLTPEQSKKVEALKAEAKVKRAKKRSARKNKKKPAPEAPPKNDRPAPAREPTD